MSESLTTRLREATAAAHERIETELNLFGPAFDLDRYARLLERWHGFELTWQRVAPHALAAIVPADFVQARRKLHLLAADLRACGRSAESIERLPAVPDGALPWQTPAGAAGVLYVVEGSTLGGQHVAKTIRSKLGLTPEHGVGYFSSYGPNVGVRWRETKAALESLPESTHDDVVASANATFAYLTDWLAPATKTK